MIVDTISAVSRKSQIFELLNYEYPTGMPHQKSAGINWLQNIGVHTNAEHLVIVSGTQNGLALSLLALFEPGNRIAVDSFTYANFIELAKLYHLQLVPIPGDDQGMKAEELELQHKLNPLHGVFLMPSCCNPTTIVISEQRKKELASVITRHQLILIEDDIHAFFTAGIIPDYQGAIARFAPEQTVYLCGTSKPICSGLRVAYMVYPDKFKDKLLKAVFNVNVKTCSLSVEIITQLILSGKAHQIVECKRNLAEKANALFGNFFPDTNNLGHPLSFYRWLPIHDKRRGTQIEQELQNSGIRVYHSDRFAVGSREKQSLFTILHRVSSRK